MPIPAPYRLEPLAPDRKEDILRLDAWAFPTSFSLDDLLALETHPFPWGRVFGVSREGTSGLAGLYMAYSLEAYTVPGARVRCGWLSWVGVHPGHRRRGILRGMIESHLAGCRARGEAVSGLFAAEPAIYGRFGYGMAAPQLSLTIPRGAALRPVAGSEELDVELCDWDAAQHGDLVAELHRAYGEAPSGLGRPGWASWETPELQANRDADPAVLREGHEPLRLAIVRDAAGTPLAYAQFRRKSSWGRVGPSGTVGVANAAALTPAATRRLWSVLLDLDLTSEVKVLNLPIDDPLVHLLVDVRRAAPDFQDNTWLRIVDVDRALTERRFSAPVDVVLEVRDELLRENAGRWRVRAEGFGHAEVTRTDADPQLTLDIRELGAAHLGTVTLATLAHAGLIEVHDARALAEASVAWSWPIAAATNWIF